MQIFSTFTSEALDGKVDCISKPNFKLNKESKDYRRLLFVEQPFMNNVRNLVSQESLGNQRQIVYISQTAYAPNCV